MVFKINGAIEILERIMSAEVKIPKIDCMVSLFNS